MSAEPARRPEDEEASRPQGEEEPRTQDEIPPQDEEAPRPAGDANAEDAGPPANTDAPSADEALPADASEPVDSATEPLPPADAETVAAAAASQDPVAAEAAVVAADAQGAESTAEAVATIDAASDEAAAQAKTAEDAAAEKKERSAARRRRVGGALRTVATVVIGTVLLVAGIAIGNYVFLTTRTAPTALSDPGTNLQNPPPAAQEFISALAVNDADAIRSSLDAGPHIDLSREMEKYGIQSVDSVDVLGTTVDGPRSATEILMHYQREDGIAFAINLVILVNDGKIEGFR